MNLKGNGHRAPSPLWRFLLLGLAAVVALVLLVRLGDRLLGPSRTILVAAEDLSPGQELTPGLFVEKQVRVSKLPPDTTTDPSMLEGLRLSRAKTAGSPFVPEDFAARTSDTGSVTRIIPPGRVLMTLQIADNAAPFPDLRRGDRLNVVGVAPTWHGSVAQDAYMIGWIQPRETARASDRSKLFGVDVTPPSIRKPVETVSLLLGVRPIDVMPLAQAQAFGARLSLVVHGSREIAEGRILDLTGPQPPKEIEVELIAGAERRKVALAR
jgi:Flp pilus assembly protein CpaB